MILEPKKIKSVSVSTFPPSICHEMMRLDVMIFIIFLNVEFQASFFTLIKTVFSSFSLSAIRVVSSVYLRLLIFLPAILIPACGSSNLAEEPGWKLNKQGDNIQP